MTSSKLNHERTFAPLILQRCTIVHCSQLRPGDMYTQSKRVAHHPGTADDETCISAHMIVTVVPRYISYQPYLSPCSTSPGLRHTLINMFGISSAAAVYFDMTRLAFVLCMALTGHQSRRSLIEQQETDRREEAESSPSNNQRLRPHCPKLTNLAPRSRADTKMLDSQDPPSRAPNIAHEAERPDRRPDIRRPLTISPPISPALPETRSANPVRG